MLLPPLLLMLVGVCTGDLLNVRSPIQPVTVTALGRPFGLGDLYDRKREVIIPGPKIWSNEVLSKYDETPSHSTNFAVSMATNVDEVCKHFDIKASLKAAFLSGTIQVGGSASYLYNKQMSNNQARVSLKYHSTTFKRSIRPDTFANATYPSVLEKVKDATDVVVAIQYGAGAVFVFDRALQRGESKSNIEGMLSISVKKIPSFVIEGKGKVNISTAERKFVEKFACTFHGDFVLKEHPGNYEEAIAVYKNLPSLLGEDYKNSVPVKVWLYPLSMLPFTTSSIQLYEIQQNLITSIADEIEALENNMRRAFDMMTSFVAEHHPRIRQNVGMFSEYVRMYQMKFQQKLAALLPKIRDGREGNEALIRLLNEKRKTPFSDKRLKMWVDVYTEEVNVLRTISDLPNYCKNDGEFSATLLNNDRRFTVTLTLKLNRQDDNQLDDMKKYLDGHSDLVETTNEMNKWWKPGQMALSRLQQYSAMIKEYERLENSKEQNGVVSDIQFAVRELILTDPSQKPEILIEVFENGKLASSHQIPADVRNIEITSITHNTVALKWDPPATGADNVLNYVVVAYEPKTKHSAVNRTCDDFYCRVLSVKTTSTQAVVNGLDAYKTYAFSVETYCSLGKSAESFKTEEVMTKRCPPGMRQLASGDPHHCVSCEPGQYADEEGSLLCLSCFQGTYSDTFNTVKCHPCPMGSYNEETGQTRCTKCPPGTWGDYPGAFASFWCHPCPAGTYNSKKGQQSEDACMKCPRGSYAPNTGTVRCSLCPFGSQTKGTGSESPSACERTKGVMEKAEKSVAALKVSAEGSIAKTGVRIDALEVKSKMLSDESKTAIKKLQTEVSDTTKAGEDFVHSHKLDSVE